jgi:hypothetical protein
MSKLFGFGSKKTETKTTTTDTNSNSIDNKDSSSETAKIDFNNHVKFEKGTKK